MKTIENPTWKDECWASKLSPRLLNLYRCCLTDQPSNIRIKVLIKLDSFHFTPELEVPVLSLLYNSITSKISFIELKQLALSDEVTGIDLA